VKRAVAELTQAGAIEHLATGWAGQKAVYKLTLGSARIIDDDESTPEEMGGLIDPPVGGPTSPPMGGPSGPKRGASQAPPRNQEEPLDEREEDQGVDLPTTSHPPRATAETTKPDSSTRPAKCPTHGLGGGLRPDGLPECTLCRVELRRASGPPDPDPPPLPPRRARCPYGVPLVGAECGCAPCLQDAKERARVAPVIDLRTRRPA
jgi:hypothetical protein